MPQYSTSKDPTWEEVINEEGAVPQFFTSLEIVVGITIAIVIVAKLLGKVKLNLVTPKMQYIGIFTVCALLIITGIFFQVFIFIVPAAIVAFFAFVVMLVPIREAKAETFEDPIYIPQEKKYLIYHGYDLSFPSDAIHTILTKHSHFYNGLHASEKEKFIDRLNDFMDDKKFIIHDTSGFREMPVLISASAIQLSFGLKKYMLPSFDIINIYPQEFMRYSPSIRFVIGNVCDNCINISWKHFLSGFQIADNGENVGLHEMSHAYYCQNFVSNTDVDTTFKFQYQNFERLALTELEPLRKVNNNLYTPYGLTNEQEFWAESVELFFEKPIQMKTAYPAIYEAMSSMLRQYPAERIMA